MARPRSFDVDVVQGAAAAVLRRLGYEAASVDELVAATGLHRGSLYGAFGSKRGLLVAVLQRVVASSEVSPAALDGATMTVQTRGLHQLWGFKRRIVAPLEHVRGATVDPGIVHESAGFRAPGLGLGRLATIGTFYRDDQRHFWDVTAGGDPIVIELTGERYDRLIVEVDGPRATIDAINAAAAR